MDAGAPYTACYGTSGTMVNPALDRGVFVKYYYILHAFETRTLSKSGDF